MSEDEKNITPVTQQKKVTKKNDFWLKLTVIVGILVGLYFIMSPYQNCMRELDNPRLCFIRTSW